MMDRIRTVRRASARLAFLVPLLAVAVGCGLFKPDPDPGDPPKPFQYPDLSTPQNVLVNLRESWNRRDSLRTKEIYAEGYQGESTDENGVKSTYTRDWEAATVWSLGKAQEVTSVDFTLPPESTWVRLSYPSDPAGWTAIQLAGYSIQVNQVNNTLLAHQSSLFEFRFEPTPDTASPTDTTWRIVRWKEVQ